MSADKLMHVRISKLRGQTKVTNMVEEKEKEGRMKAGQPGTYTAGLHTNRYLALLTRYSPVFKFSSPV